MSVFPLRVTWCGDKCTPVSADTAGNAVPKNLIGREKYRLMSVRIVILIFNYLHSTDPYKGKKQLNRMPKY